MKIGISSKIAAYMETGSWIRRMFEEGNELKRQVGAENVFDFSLGNPMGEPPDRFIQALKDSLSEPIPGKHGYMPNAGYADVRDRLAEVLSREYGIPMTGRHLIMTVGAAGALNVTLKALINPGDTVLIFAPYFVEYRYYIDNVGGICRVVETDDMFNLDIPAIEKAMDPTVKALVINTPNNPTGRVYSEETLMELGRLIDRKALEYGHPIFILSDEPYKRIVYGDVTVPCLFRISPNAFICTSYSKELSIPGERLGYIAVNPACEFVDQVINAFTFCNRILGYVNAPALMQRALGKAPDAMVDITPYRTNRELLLKSLQDMGYNVFPPEGAFYMFPRSPIADEVEFTTALKSERILTVPGRGFGRAGYFRIAYCVSRDIIERSLPGFQKTLEKFR